MDNPKRTGFYELTVNWGEEKIEIQCPDDGIIIYSEPFNGVGIPQELDLDALLKHEQKFHGATDG